MQGAYLTADEVTRQLGIRRETLYAYVSRGLIRSEPGPGRSRLYAREDVERLRLKKDLRHHGARALETALHFGDALLDSSLTLIEDGEYYYRGENALALAEDREIEAVAALLWLGDEAAAEGLFAEDPNLPEDLLPWRDTLDALEPVEALQVLLPLLAHREPAAWIPGAPAVARCGARMLGQMVLWVAGGPWRGSVVDTLAAGWGLGREEARHLLRTALVLCSDHELNVSSFTARCVASAGSTPHAAVSAGLAALIGTRHGGHTRRVEALLEACPNPEQLPDFLGQRLRRGESLPGFGQKLYPRGDPRQRTLSSKVQEACPGSPAVAWQEAYAETGRALTGEHATIDLGLVAVAHALDLPRGSALTLFALSRTVGWIAHFIEQSTDGEMIRPRARYVGARPNRGQGA
jgi:citrate synthase